MFHQPFDINEEIYKEAYNFIEKYYNHYLDSLIKLEKEKNISGIYKESERCETLLYEEYLIKAIATVFTIKLMQGDFSKLMIFLKFLKNLFLKSEKEYKALSINIQKLNNKLITRSLNDKMDLDNKNLNLPKFYLKNIFEFVKENNILPIMRNYSIYDISSLSKNILFTPIRHFFSNCSSVTTDSSYLYIILSGVNGGMIKLGTGYNKTIKGKIYLHVKFTDSNLLMINNPNLNLNSTNKNNNINQNLNSANDPLTAPSGVPVSNVPLPINLPDIYATTVNNVNNPNPVNNANQYIINEDISYQWVFLKGNLYLKQNTSNSNYLGNNSAFSGISSNSNKDLSYLTIIDPESFKVEGKIKLVLPEDAKHPAIKKKNENFVLLTDGENLNILLLDPIFKNKDRNKSKEKNKENLISIYNGIGNSDSEENENFIPETIIQKENTSNNKKNKYASYAASATNNFRTENLPNFQEDLFSYINLNLLTFKVDKISENLIKKTNSIDKSNINKKLKEAEKNIYNTNKDCKENSLSKKNPNNANIVSDESVNEAELILITEIYGYFSHIYTLEECRKALILNNWNAEKTAVFLTDNENEIKQPLLIAEKSTVLFQTKIDSICTRNNRVEYKIIKNPIFDTTQFDLLKWTMTKDTVFGYKLKEGACIIFDANPSSQRDFPYSYNEKIKISSPSAIPNNPRNSLAVKSNKAKFNVNWKEGISELGIGDCNLNDEGSIEKKILETIRIESMIDSKVVVIPVNDINNNKINENINFNNNLGSNFVSPSINNENKIIQNYLNQALNMEDIANLSNYGMEKSPSKFINAYLVKNEIKKGIKPQILRGSSSSFSTSNANNNFLNSNFSSSFAYNPLNNNNFGNSVPSGSDNYNANLNDNYNVISSTNNNLNNTINNTNNTISNNKKAESKYSNNLNNYISLIKENINLLQNDNNYNDFNDKEIKKPSKKFYENQNEASLDGKKKIRDAILSNKDEILNKVYIKKPNENINNEFSNSKTSESPNKTEIIDELVFNDTIKGTFIKVIPCLQMMKLDTIFCYDHLNKIYYLLGNSSVSINLMISNTYCVDSKITELLFKQDFTDEANTEEKDSIMKELETFIENDLSIEQIENESDKDSYNELIEFIKKFTLMINKNKQEMPWKYTNWNYFYHNLYELINMVNYSIINKVNISLFVSSFNKKNKNENIY